MKFPHLMMVEQGKRRMMELDNFSWLFTKILFATFMFLPLNLLHAGTSHSTTSLQESVIGDKKRSPESSKSFFSSIDRDDDGILGRGEIANFLRNQIGGAAFDTKNEVDLEVGAVIEHLDLNEDIGIDASDIYAYWNKLDRLLTTQEVADWVVHAVQLPESIGRIFLENAVTGYDFPELVESNGKALSRDLNIQKSHFRTKLLRHIKARMLGIGDVPDKPVKVNFSLESCNTVKIFWKTPKARGFPVHSYRVQRRSVEQSGGHSSTSDNPSIGLTSQNACFDKSSISLDDSCDASIPSGQPEKKAQKVWTNIHDGAETEYVDAKLELDRNYIYRVQAWNAVGSSDWVQSNLSSVLKKKGCFSSSFRSDIEYTWLEWIQSFWGASQSTFRVLNIFYAILQIVAFTGAALAAVMKIKLASNEKGNLGEIPWLSRRISDKLSRLPFLDVFEVGNNDITAAHDVSVGAVQLDGYKKQKNGVGDAEDKRSIRSRRDLVRHKSFSTGNLNDNILDKKDTSEQVPPKILKKRAPSDFYDNITTSALFSSSLERNSLRSSKSNETKSLDSSESNDSSISRHSQREDHRRCNTCCKTYKFGKRRKHHCSRCLSTFCHKHGRTTHSNFTSCRFPGSCVCMPCLKFEEDNNLFQNTKFKRK